VALASAPSGGAKAPLPLEIFEYNGDQLLLTYKYIANRDDGH